MGVGIRSILDPIIVSTLPHATAAVVVWQCGALSCAWQSLMAAGSAVTPPGGAAHTTDTCVAAHNERAYVWLAYFLTICGSTLCSVLWHLFREPPGPLAWLDHGLAGLWALCELVLAVMALVQGQGGQLLTIVITSNLVTGILHRVSSSCVVKGAVGYDWAHTVWHAASAARAITVAVLLTAPFR